jgi:hypothetical protein
MQWSLRMTGAWKIVSSVVGLNLRPLSIESSALTTRTRLVASQDKAFHVIFFFISFWKEYWSMYLKIFFFIFFTFRDSEENVAALAVKDFLEPRVRIIIL